MALRTVRLSMNLFQIQDPSRGPDPRPKIPGRVERPTVKTGLDSVLKFGETI